jgi:DNA-binding transcriptional LysR family regulator
LVKLLEDYELPKLCLQVIYPPTRHLSSKVRLFTDMVAEEYSAVHF